MQKSSTVQIGTYNSGIMMMLGHNLFLRCSCFRSFSSHCRGTVNTELRNYFICLSGNLQLNTLMELLTILDSHLRDNDTFFQSVPSFSVIPAKAGIQELIDNLSIIGKQIYIFSLCFLWLSFYLT